MLILIAHGSRNPAWRASVERVVAETERRLGDGHMVRLAYMDCTPPTLQDVLAEVGHPDLERVDVLPLFLADEGHVNRDVGPLVEEARQAFPHLSITLLPAMGQHPAFVTLLYEIAVESEG